MFNTGNWKQKLGFMALGSIFTIIGVLFAIGLLPSVTAQDNNANKDKPIGQWIGSWDRMRFLSSTKFKLEKMPGYKFIFNPNGSWEIQSGGRGLDSRGIYQVFEDRFIIQAFYSEFSSNPGDKPDATKRGTWNLNGNILLLIDEHDGYQILKRAN